MQDPSSVTGRGRVLGIALVCGKDPPKPGHDAGGDPRTKQRRFGQVSDGDRKGTRSGPPDGNRRAKSRDGADAGNGSRTMPDAGHDRIRREGDREEGGKPGQPRP